jgi:dihydroorotate dehydrogenase (NAD+) catalytic subunit
VAAAVALETTVGSLRLASPIMTASGTAGHGAELGAYMDLDRLGAVVVKSLAAFAWPGNPLPRVVGSPVGMLNSVGLQGPGVDAWIEEELPALKASKAAVVVSIWGRTVEEFAAVAKRLREVDPCVIAVEVNLSCPNLEDGHHMFAHDPRATAEAVEAAGEARLPRWAKLSPNVADLPKIAAAAIAAGAEAVTLVNTLLAMAIEVETRRFALGAGGGGLSGASLHPVAVRAVHDCRQALPDAAIVGVGGVSCGRDAIELMMAGANAVQVGTATLVDPRAPSRILAELEAWCAAQGIGSAEELIGVAR